MGIRAYETQVWDPDNTTSIPVQSVIVLEDVTKTEKALEVAEKTEPMTLPKQKKRRLTAVNRKARRKIVYKDSFDLSGEGLDGNPLGGTTLD